MSGKNEIVFEDLRGVPEDPPELEVNLDSELNDEGIERVPAGKAANADASDDDDIRVGDIVPDDDSGMNDDGADGASRRGEDDDYSKRVKARIEREQRQTAKARDEARYWREHAQRLSKAASKGERQALEQTVEQATSAIEQARSDLERAIEDGNTKEQVRLTDYLTDLKGKKISAEARLQDFPEDGGDLPSYSGNVDSDATGQSSESEADKWMRSRSDWYRKPGFERATRAANRIDKELYTEGYDANDPAYFEELDRRMAKIMPELYDDDGSAEQTGDTKRKRGQSAVAGDDGTSDTRRQTRDRSGRVKLTKADFDNMRRFGLDPNDNEHVKEYARNKAESRGARA